VLRKTKTAFHAAVSVGANQTIRCRSRRAAECIITIEESKSMSELLLKQIIDAVNHNAGLLEKHLSEGVYVHRQQEPSCVLRLAGRTFTRFAASAD
jgi:hypothetical protein